LIPRARGFFARIRNYFKLRDVGRVFDFGVAWDGAQNTIAIDTSESYTDD
jgi:hypothetical protein